MALSAFADKSSPPSEAELAATLGKAFRAWNELKRRVGTHASPLAEVWGYTSKSTGWGLRLKHGERVILYMTPCAGHFLASLALGEKAVAAAREAGLPPAVLAQVESAKRYAEGRGVRLEVRSLADVRAVEKLARIKAER